MFKFLKRAFINNDKKKDEIILSDIYRQNSSDFLSIFTGRKTKTIVNLCGIGLVSIFVLLNITYFFTKDDNIIVTSTGKVTEIVYKYFPVDLQILYQSTTVTSFEKKNISLQNIRFDNNKPNKLQDSHGTLEPLDTSDTLDNKILSSFIKNDKKSILGFHKKETLKDTVKFFLNANFMMQKLYDKYQISSMNQMIFFNFLIFIVILSSLIIYYFTRKIIVFVVNLIVGKRIISYYDFEDGRNDGVKILFINNDIEREFKNKLSDLFLNDRHKFIELTNNLLFQINNDNSSLLLNDNKIYIDDFYRDNGKIFFYYSTMNEIIDFKNISENPENSSLSEKHFNSRIDLIKQKDNELIKLKDKLLIIEENSLLADKLMNNDIQIANSDLFIKEIEDLYKNKRLNNG